MIFSREPVYHGEIKLERLNTTHNINYKHERQTKEGQWYRSRDVMAG